jgi:hypothetical protein
MSARFSSIAVTFNGQSQALMAAGGGGETVDDPMASLPTAGVHMKTLLETWMPGVTVTVSAVSGPGPQTYTAVGGTALVRSLNGGSDAFWHDTNNALDVHGIAQREHMLTFANASRLGVFIHWSQTQDASSASYTDSLYATSVTGYYTAINDAVASSFGEFRILTLVPGARDGGADVAARLGGMRRIFEAIGGAGRPFAGANQLSFCMPPVHATPFTPRGAYINGSPDFVHPIRSASYRFARAVATAIALRNGVIPPTRGQPRLVSATLTNPTTLVARFVSPARLPLRRQGSGGFTVTAGSITNQAGAFNNANVATTGYATLTLSVSGVTPGARLQFWAGMGGYSEFVNGTTPPRGALANAIWADPGNTPSVTDAAEDCTGSDIPLFAAPNQFGAVVETP